jgi:hypothetical protein
MNITRQAMYVQRNIEVRSCKHRCSGKAICITYSECVFVALGIQHSMRMHRILSVLCLGLQYFSTLSDKWHDFRKAAILNIQSVLIPSKFCLKHFSF